MRQFLFGFFSHLAESTPPPEMPEGIGFQTEWSISEGDAATRTVSLPLPQLNTDGTTLGYNFFIDWGDLTPITKILSSTDINKTHTYSTGGVYNVEIKGVMEGWNFGDNNSYNSNQKITRVLNWGSTGFEGFKSLYKGFYNCYNLTSIGSGIASIPAKNGGVTKYGFAYTFIGCSSLSSIPNELFKYHANNYDDSGDGSVGLFYSTFEGCESLVSLPADLFMYNISTVIGFKYTFSECVGLTSLPTDLFRYNTEVTEFYDVFFYCINILDLPADLFRYNTKVTSFSYCFEWCQSLTSLPATLFLYNTLATDFSFVFDSCTGLLSIPADLFNGNNGSLLTLYSAFSSCSSLTSIPANLFKFNTNLSDIGSCFSDCISLGSIPVDLFKFPTAIEDASACFYGCTSLTSLPANLFSTLINLQSVRGCFSDCISLTSLPANLFSTLTNLESVQGCFFGCTSLTSIPSDLFVNNLLITDFQYCFMNCVKLQMSGDIFSLPAEYATRFLDKSIDFSYFFNISLGSFTGITGIAPELWSYSYGTGIPIKSLAFRNHDVSTLTNYASIPIEWK